MIDHSNSYSKLLSKCTQEELDAAQNYLKAYRLCEKMLHLRDYERKRTAKMEEPANAEQILQASACHWELQIVQTKQLINDIRNGREKMILYYHFIRGESVESAARLIGISRRTGYRMLEKGVALVALCLRQRAEEDGANCKKIDTLPNE